MNRPTGTVLIVAILSAMGVALLRQLVFPDAYWWPIMMIGVLLVALALLIWRERQGPD